MSIVIRLQNLPLNAKSADIRNFFGGLRIPSGGVHILGGDNGDAFIAFNTDEDARVAMRKDGGKIKDSRVKLFLSSRMEMQYEVEKLTKSTFKDSSQMMQGPERSPRTEMDHSLNERKYDGNRSRESRWDPNFGRQRERSRSPRRRSRSRKSPSPNSQTYFRERPDSPDYSFSAHGKNSSGMETDLNSSYSWGNSKDNSKFGLSTSELQAELERRITEVLEQNPILMSGGNMEYNERPPVMNASYGNMNASYGNMMPPPVPQVPFLENIPNAMPPNNMLFPPPIPMPPLFNNQQPFYQGAVPVPPPIPNAAPAMYGQNDMGPSRMVNAFYATVSGLDPVWDHKEIQMLLKGMFIPQSNIRWELDNMGRKTGTAFIKLLNRDSFENLIKQATFMFNNRRLTVSECPNFVVAQYFGENSRPVEYDGAKKEFCYFLKGLHFQCSYEDVINFFSGLEVNETIILYGKESRATGIGYVSFTNQRDYEAAFALNGKTMPHTNRFIEMKPCSERDLIRAKTNHPSAQTFTSYSKLLAEMNVSPTRRPLCAIITGLSHITTVNKLTGLFSDSGFKADAVHITLNRKVCDGRAFIEFSNFRDFDLALQLHNKMFLDSKISVKQILYDEMKKILDFQKAKHFFDFPTSAVPEFMNATEKVPYLWEPPDTPDEQQKMPSSSWPTSQNNIPPKENLWPKSRNNFSRKENLGPMSQNNFPPRENVWPRDQNSSLPQEKQFPNEEQFPNNNNPPNFQMNMIRKSPKQRFAKPRERFLSEIPRSTKKALIFPNKKNLPGKSSMTKPSPQQGNWKNNVQKPNSQKSAVAKPPPQGILKNARKDSPKPDLQKSGVTKPTPSQGNQRNINKSLPPKENIRDPIKFNVNKPLAVNTKKNETFEQAEPAEKKIKLSKLSPEKEATPKPVPKELPNKKGNSGPKELPNKKVDSGPKELPNKKVDSGSKELPNKKVDSGSKELPNKKVDTKKVTPEVKDVKTPATEKKGFVKKDFKAKPNFAQKRFPRGPDNFGKRPFERLRSPPPFVSPPRFLSPPRHIPCPVQFTMVHPFVGTHDFMEFLRGFAYDPGSIIRRYTDDGEPTGDVRVTFLNRKEAELAIRNLEGVYLMDMRIGMFIP